MALSNFLRWPNETPSFLRSSSVKSGRTEYSISFSAKVWAYWPSSLLKKLARAKGVVIHFPGVILREGEDARTVPGSGRPFLVHPAGGADSGGSSAARDTQARSRGLEGAEP